MLHIGKRVLNPLPTRGEIAAQEQVRIFGRTFTSKVEPRAPLNRGEIAAQEQMRIIQQSLPSKTIQSREPKTRGEIAAQEQMRIIGHVTGTFGQIRKTEGK